MDNFIFYLVQIYAFFQFILFQLCLYKIKTSINLRILLRLIDLQFSKRKLTCIHIRCCSVQLGRLQAGWRRPVTARVVGSGARRSGGRRLPPDPRTVRGRPHLSPPRPVPSFFPFLIATFKETMFLAKHRVSFISLSVSGKS